MLLVLMLLAAFAEILSIGAVLPFLGVLTAPEHIYSHALAQPLIRLLGLPSPESLLLPLTVLFCIAALLTGALRLTLLWASTRLSFATGADLSIGIYRRTLYQPYAVHVSRNSSEIISGISSKSHAVIYSTIVPAMTLVTTAMMLIMILMALLTVNPVIALSAMGGFGLIYAVIIRLSRRRLRHNSELIARESTNVIKALQEGLGGIRDVLVDGTQSTYCDIYRSADAPLRRAQGNNMFIAQGPRYAMETLGMLLISGLALVLAREADGLAKAIPVLGALALGAQRLLPVLQQAYMAWSNIHGNLASLQDALDLLDQPLPDYAFEGRPTPIPFGREISLQQIGFRYGELEPWVLHGISLSIARGERVGFIGKTGCGKSTLLDIIMGLLQPSQGALVVDGQAITPENLRAWQAHIAHVPQAIFLADGSIEENIAFGVPDSQIDRQRVREAARKAQIADIIESWPRQYETHVGERGVRLSGGQRQRIGIARALYKQADVIIFDEATSALDYETERSVMQAIEALGEGLTVLIIAHRIDTLKICSKIVELEGGIVKRVGAYQDIVG